MQTINNIISSAAPVESKPYRDVMSHYAGAVQIVTTAGPAGRRGLTLTAACSVSDNPPTILICLQKIHAENRLFIENGVFAINTLAGSHEQLADAFSGRIGLTQDERFELARWDMLVTGAPVLLGGLATFDCRVVSVQDHSTHHVLFGEVVGLRSNTEEEALIYLNRRYHKLEL
ncbi:flavin reductase (DIM6/NTAB) family NADH-FMN oxidoreductase RutF [Ochrobactrum daejeonense]|uniref:Flavin reductase (DIM6/NTAB) family NADH-FMN oxidoreductase RutF n=1 Tax=Brucella daejeonensis TaxID=659015 RepID=A0A7W9AW34_9HYPH|nr:flavin reductase [Brucella daejeonensis]MBB5701679.1 flavin reductase (DIM6/NTAB) family NADH-FMN oxidoreductase RutF [Brucella daejeonensis]NKB79083.1 flavin reductase [Brucella daejeonensis]